MSTAEKLREAKALIEDPARWCQGAGARAADGRAVDALASVAVQWCAGGAFKKAGIPLEEFTHGIMRMASGRKEPWAVNDHLDHEAVMQMFDRAIELAEEAE